MMHLRKEPQCNENVMILKIDDPSIVELGEWPWSRDIMADALLRMKELGAYNAIFDIEYISPSKNGIAPSAELKIADKLDYTHRPTGETTNTPPVVVYLYSAQIEVLKVDGADEEPPLEGAEFVLRQKGTNKYYEYTAATTTAKAKVSWAENNEKAFRSYNSDININHS